MIKKTKYTIRYDNDDEAEAWQDLINRLADVYTGEYTFTNIVEAMMAVQGIFYDLLTEE